MFSLDRTPGARMTHSGELRYCPVCARVTDNLHCPDDGAVTIARKCKKGSLPLKIGAQLDGRYRVVRVIGRGGFGVVYAARHLVSNQDLAIKVMCEDSQGDITEAIARFNKEARVLARLRHPNTVRVFDVGYTDKGHLYIAMELLCGPNLEQVLAEMGSRDVVMTEPQILDVAIPVLGSLGEAHRLGLVHRDMKPANIVLVQMPDEPFQVKVLDFGVVRTADSSLTSNQTALGTPDYMSPEQCLSAELDGRSDLYAVGCLMFEATCGSPPYRDRSHMNTMYNQMQAAIPNLREKTRTPHSDAYVHAIRRVMSKEPEQRFADAREMRRELQRIRADAWGDVPHSSLTDLISARSLRKSKSLWRIVVGEETGPVGQAAAVLRAGAGSQDLDGTLSLHAEDDASPRQNRRCSSSEEIATSREPTEHALPSFRASSSSTRRGASLSKTPSEAVEVDQVEEGALTGLPWSEPELMSPVADGATETDDEAKKTRPQSAVCLPNLSTIEDAIRRREEQIAEQAMAKTGSATMPGADSSHSEKKGGKKRVPQVAPPSADDEKAAKRGRKQDFGKGTLIGTGVKFDSDGGDGSAKP